MTENLGPAPETEALLDNFKKFLSPRSSGANRSSFDAKGNCEILVYLGDIIANKLVNFMKIKIFDCITFFRENFQFDLRFNILKDYVDCFIICEAKKDHQGKEKKLNFDLKKYSRFNKKIIYLVCDNFPNNLNPWQRQAYQRNYILNGLNKAKPEDYIIFSDPDEIPRPEKLININLKKKYGIFMQNSYCYKFNIFTLII
jgi:hypothetical protein